MSYFLRDRTTGIKGLRLPLGIEDKLIDAEYADKTTLYVEDDEDICLSVLPSTPLVPLQVPTSTGTSQLDFLQIGLSFDLAPAVGL